MLFVEIDLTFEPMDGFSNLKKYKSLKILPGIHWNCQINESAAGSMILPKKPRIQIQIRIQNTVKNCQKGFIEALWHAKAFKMATFLIKLVQGRSSTLTNSIYGSNFSGADLIANKNIKRRFFYFKGCHKRNQSEVGMSIIIRNSSWNIINFQFYKST